MDIIEPEEVEEFEKKLVDGKVTKYEEIEHIFAIIERVARIPYYM